MKVYFVVAEYNAYLPYGVDMRSYFCGICATRERAQERIDYLKEAIEECKNALTREDTETVYSDYEELTGMNLRPEGDPYGDDNDDYDWDVDFEIEETNVWQDTCLYIGGHIITRHEKKGETHG